MEPLTTEVWSLNFLVKGHKICFITRTPQGVEKRYWADLPPRTAKAISKEIDEHVQAKEEEAKMTWEQKQEMYKEYGGS